MVSADVTEHRECACCETEEDIDRLLERVDREDDMELEEDETWCSDGFED